MLNAMWTFTLMKRDTEYLYINVSIPFKKGSDFCTGRVVFQITAPSIDAVFFPMIKVNVSRTSMAKEMTFSFIVSTYLVNNKKMICWQYMVHNDAQQSDLVKSIC